MHALHSSSVQSRRVSTYAPCALVAAVGLAAAAGHARPIIVAGGPVIAPPASVATVAAGGFATPIPVAFLETPASMFLPAPTQVDPGGRFIPVNTLVDSHMIFASQIVGGNSWWCFDGLIVGVMSDQNGNLEAASNYLGAPGTFYPGAFANRGLEPALGDRYTVSRNFIDVTANVALPGDWMRVVTNNAQRSGISFGIDHQGPSRGAPDSWYGAPIDEGDILSVGLSGAPNEFRMPNPPVPGAPAPGVLVGRRGLGLLSTAAGFCEVDAISYGHDTGPVFAFSVDEWAMGVAGMPSAVYVSGAAPAPGSPTPFEAAADVFTTVNGGGNAAFIDGGQLGLVEPNMPNMGVPDNGDNLDALDVSTSTADLKGRIYFSVEGNLPDAREAIVGTATGGAQVPPVSPADILVLNPCSITPAVYAQAGPDLRLNPQLDDLDALALWDDGDGQFNPAVDRVFFSVKIGSNIIGAIDCRLGLPIGPGDILTTRAQGGCGPCVAGVPCRPAIWRTATQLGLMAGPNLWDDLDALDRVAAADVCYADCNGDGALTVGDFGCFQTQFAIASPTADCNGDGVLTVGDFGCFQTLFAIGCP